MSILKISSHLRLTENVAYQGQWHRRPLQITMRPHTWILGNFLLFKTICKVPFQDCHHLPHPVSVIFNFMQSLKYPPHLFKGEFSFGEKKEKKSQTSLGWQIWTAVISKELTVLGDVIFCHKTLHETLKMGSNISPLNTTYLMIILAIGNFHLSQNNSQWFKCFFLQTNVQFFKKNLMCVDWFYNLSTLVRLFNVKFN